MKAKFRRFMRYLAVHKTKVIIISVISALVIAGAAVGIVIATSECDHDWQNATCVAPKTCSKCSETEGEALGHTGGTATCTEKATCSVCSEKYGELAAHDYKAVERLPVFERVEFVERRA